MAESSPIITDFTSGELSPRLNGRVDLERYYSGAKTIKNFEVQMHGGLQKRSGTRFIASVKNSAHTTKLIPFVFSKTQAYVLEFGNDYFRIYKDEGKVTSGGSVVEIASPYGEEFLDELDYVQSADTLFLVHPNFAPRTLTRTSHTSWSFATLSFRDGPWDDTNATTKTLTPSGTSGSITITASSTTFAASDVGRLVRIKHISGSDTTWGYAQISGYTSGTVVNANVGTDFNFAATSASSDWALGAFWTDNYPAKVTFFEERLFFANTNSHPNTLFGSKSSDFTHFGPTDSDGSVNDDNALRYTLTSDQVNEITSLYGSNVLHIFSKSGTFNLASSSATAALTPTSVQASQQTRDGGSNTKVLGASKGLIYIGKNKRRVREYAYNIDYDSFTSPDMMVVSEHLGFGDIEELAFCNYPNNVIYARKGDAGFLGFTYYREQSVLAWHQHELGGVFGSGKPVVTSMAVIPGVNDAYDTLYMIVKRTIDGATVQTVEFMEENYRELSGHTKDDQYFVDCGLTYSGGAATSISGLDHLEGQTVKVLNNGAVEPDKTVSSGAITLDNSTTKCHIGLGYDGVVETLNIEPRAQYGTAQGKVTRIDKVIFRLFETLGIKAGSSSSNLDELLIQKTSNLTFGTPLGPQTGDFEIKLAATYDRANSIYILSDTPRAATINALLIQMSSYS